MAYFIEPILWAGKRHCPSAAIFAPSKCPPTLSTMVDAGSWNKVAGNENQYPVPNSANSPNNLYFRQFFTGEILNAKIQIPNIIKKKAAAQFLEQPLSEHRLLDNRHF